MAVPGPVMLDAFVCTLLLDVFVCKLLSSSASPTQVPLPAKEACLLNDAVDFPDMGRCAVGALWVVAVAVANAASKPAEEGVPGRG